MLFKISKIVLGLQPSGSAILTPINIHPNISTNPFLSHKLHQSSSNLCSPSPMEHDSHFNRFSLDLSSNNVTPSNNNKEWTPLDDFKEFEEASRRKVTDDTIRLAHLEGRRRGIAFDSWMNNNSFRNGEFLQQFEQQTTRGTMMCRNNNLFLHKLILNKFPDITFDRLNASECENNENFRQSKYDNVDGCRYSDTTYSDATRYSDPWHWEAPYQIGDSSTLSKQANKAQKTATISRHRKMENQHILSKCSLSNIFKISSRGIRKRQIRLYAFVLYLLGNLFIYCKI